MSDTPESPQMEDARPQTCRFRRCATFGCGACALLTLVVIVGLAIYASITRAEGRAQVEARLQALRDEGSPVTPAELNAFYPAVPDEENGALVYLQAFDKYVEYDAYELVLDEPVKEDDAGEEDDAASDDDTEENEDGFAEEDATMEEWLPLVGVADLDPGAGIPPLMRAAMDKHLGRNAEALALLKKAATYSRFRYPLDAESKPLMYDMPLDHLAPLREASRLLSLETIRHAADGKTAEAVASLTAARMVGRSLDDEPFFISALVSIALDSLATNGLQDLLCRADLSEAECEKLTAAWQRGQDAERMSRGFLSEACAVNQICLIDPAQWSQMQMGGTAGPLDKIALFPRLYCLFGYRDLDRAYLLGFLHEAAKISRLPVEERSAKMKAQDAVLDAELRRVGMRSYAMLHARFFTGLLAPALGRAGEAEIKSVAQRRMAIAALRLEQMRARTGALPASLDAVAEAFPETRLTDPFDGQRLRYRQDDSGYVLYSVGADGTDDGGDDSQKRRTEPDMIFRVSRQSLQN